MATLISNWLTVLMEGETLDGRVIEAEWLREMVETYDPGLYEASINANHFKIGMRYGRVADVRLSENQKYNKKTLQVRIVPNQFLLDLNEKKQLLHTSCEIKLNFPLVHKTYLTGLALTDNPASLGTDRLEFSAQHADHLYSAPLTLETNVIPFQKNTPLSRIGNVLSVDAGIDAQPQCSMNTLHSQSPTSNFKTDTHAYREQPDMKPEDVQAMIQKEFSAFEEKLLKQRSDSQNSDEEKTNSSHTNSSNGGEQYKSNETAGSETDSEAKLEFTAMKEEFTELKKAVQLLSATAPSTELSDNTGAANPHQDIF